MVSEISYLLLTVCMFMLACLWLSVLGTKLGIHETEPKGYSSSLEALRGLAAFLVFGAHSTMYFGLAPAQVVAAGMGNVGVFLFFMLTGHLFWGQITTGKFNANTFFPKRIRRLVPAMVFIVAVYTLLDWSFAGFPRPTMEQLLGIIRNFGFGFGKVVNSQGDVNDVFSKDMYLKINTIWTLRWEWLFYLCLPLLAALKSFRNISLFAIAIVLMFMDPFQVRNGGTDIVFVIAFWLGALSRTLEDYRKGSMAIIFNKKIYTVASLLGIAILLIYFLNGANLTQKNIRIPVMVFLVFPIFFYFVASKFHQSTLTRKSVLMAGKISYSFYLWHLGVCFYVSHLSAYLFGVKQQTWPFFIATVFVSMLISVTLSVITYRFIEAPYLRKNRS